MKPLTKRASVLIDFWVKLENLWDFIHVLCVIQGVVYIWI